MDETAYPESTVPPDSPLDHLHAVITQLEAVMAEVEMARDRLPDAEFLARMHLDRAWAELLLAKNSVQFAAAAIHTEADAAAADDEEVDIDDAVN